MIPCAAAALVSIDRGAVLFTAAAPTSSPDRDGVLAMLAVVVAASSAFGCALLARSRLRLRVRAPGCAAMLAATAGTFLAAEPFDRGVAFREVHTPSGRLRAELPGPAVFSEREAPGPGGGVLLREAEVRAGGVRFDLQEREERAPGDAAALLARARAQLIAGGALVLAEQRAEGELSLTLRADGRRFRARLIARPPLLFVASAGPEGTSDDEIARFLASLRAEGP